MQSKVYGPLRLLLFWAICNLYQFTLISNESIVFMQNFHSQQWAYVYINEDKIVEHAKALSYDEQLRPPNWDTVLPLGLTIEESFNYLLGLVAIDFCHWGVKETATSFFIFDFYTKDEKGDRVRGSMAMTALAKKAYKNNLKLFEASFMSAATVDSLRPHFMGLDEQDNEIEIPLLEERVKVMNEIGKILVTKWKGSFYNVFLASKGRILNQGLGFIEILIRDFPRYRDEYFYQDKKIGIYKLAQLSVFALENAITLDRQSKVPLFSDHEVLTLCADYQIPRCLHALGILEYNHLLEEKIQQQQLIPKDSIFEIELRMATVLAGWMLKNKINDIRSRSKDPLITSQELDHLLWNYGRQLGKDNKHHLTITTMY